MQPLGRDVRELLAPVDRNAARWRSTVEDFTPLAANNRAFGRPLETS